MRLRYHFFFGFKLEDWFVCLCGIEAPSIAILFSVALSPGKDMLTGIRRLTFVFGIYVKKENLRHSFRLAACTKQSNNYTIAHIKCNIWNKNFKCFLLLPNTIIIKKKLCCNWEKFKFISYCYGSDNIFYFFMISNLF